MNLKQRFKQLLERLLPETFERELEDAYRQDSDSQAFTQIKLAMRLLAIADVLSVALWGWIARDIDTSAWAAILPTAATWLILWGYLEKGPGKAKFWLCYLLIGTLGVASARQLMVMLTQMGNAEPYRYLFLYLSIPLIFAYIYGPFAIPTRLGILFGLLITVCMWAWGVLLGVSGPFLGYLVFLLVALNFLLAYNRHQNEVDKRRAFLDRRAALLERMDADIARQIADYSQILAEQAGSDITQFIRNSSHNLRQPLQALNSYSTVLEMALASGDPRLVREVAGKLISSIDTLSRSFDRLMDISRLATEKQTATLADIPVGHLLDYLAVQYNPAAEKKGIRLKIATSATADCVIRTDEIMMQQVLGNLVDNAIKYTAAGWVLVKARKPRNGLLRLDIIDTGIGIPAAEQEHVFKEFYRARNPQPSHGFGIGLAYVEKAIDKLPDHRLGFASRENIGTHFFIDIPLAGVSATDGTGQQACAAELAGIFVLLLDDETEVLQALAEQLVCWGCTVEKAASVREAHCVLEDNVNPPDLLITDWWLGERETAETAIHCFHALCGNRPVLIITGDTDPSDITARFAEPPTVLKKPISQSRLLQAIAAALANAPDRPLNPPASCPPPSRPGECPGDTPRR